MRDLVRQLPRPAGASPRATPQDFGAGPAVRAQAQLAGEVSEVARKRREAVLVSRTNRANVGFATELEGWVTEQTQGVTQSSQDSDGRVTRRFETIGDDFESAFIEIRDRHRAGIGENEFGQVFDDESELLFSRAKARVDQAVQRAEFDVAAADYHVATDDREKLSATLDDQGRAEERIKQGIAIDALVDAGVITAVEGVRQLEVYDDTVTAELAQHRIANAPSIAALERVIEDLSASREDEGPFRRMDANQAGVWQARAKAEKRTRIQERRAQAVNGARVTKKNALGEAGRADFDLTTMAHAGQLTPEAVQEARPIFEAAGIYRAGMRSRWEKLLQMSMTGEVPIEDKHFTRELARLQESEPLRFKRAFIDPSKSGPATDFWEKEQRAARQGVVPDGAPWTQQKNDLVGEFKFSTAEENVVKDGMDAALNIKTQEHADNPTLGPITPVVRSEIVDLFRTRVMRDGGFFFSDAVDEDAMRRVLSGMASSHTLRNEQQNEQAVFGVEEEIEARKALERTKPSRRIRQDDVRALVLLRQQRRRQPFGQSVVDFGPELSAEQSFAPEVEFDTPISPDLMDPDLVSDEDFPEQLQRELGPQTPEAPLPSREDRQQLGLDLRAATSTEDRVMIQNEIDRIDEESLRLKAENLAGIGQAIAGIPGQIREVGSSFAPDTGPGAAASETIFETVTRSKLQTQAATRQQEAAALSERLEVLRARSLAATQLAATGENSGE